jgi:DNA replication and repair protein RecF
MFVKSFEIQNFRNIESEKRNVTSGITAFIAKNGAGKTNRLESIFVASVGKSFKAGKEEEMIAFQKDIARIKVGIEKKEGEEEVEVILTRGQIKMAEEVFQKAQKKKLMVNGVPKRQIDFAGNLLVTVFGPWDVDLITDPPSARRKFLDYVLSQVDREYRRCLLSYEKGVRQRNRILLNIRENNAPRSQLLFWDKLLIKNGDYISRVRDEFIQFIKKTPPNL